MGTSVKMFSMQMLLGAKQKRHFPDIVDQVWCVGQPIVPIWFWLVLTTLTMRAYNQFWPRDFCQGQWSLASLWIKLELSQEAYWSQIFPWDAAGFRHFSTYVAISPSSLRVTIGWALQMPSRRHIWCHIRLPVAAFCWITFLGERFLSPFCKPVDYKTINSGDLLHSHRLQNRKLNKREKTKTPVSLTNQFRIQGLGTPTTHMPGQQNNGGVATKMKMWPQFWILEGKLW